MSHRRPEAVRVFLGGAVRTCPKKRAPRHPVQSGGLSLNAGLRALSRWNGGATILRWTVVGARPKDARLVIRKGGRRLLSFRMGESWSEFALSRSGGPYRIELRRGSRAVDAMTLDEGFEECLPIMLEDGAQKVRVVVWVSIPPMFENHSLFIDDI